MVDVQRGTSGVNLPNEVSTEIWENVVEQSVVQKVATQISLPGNGVSVDIISGEATASTLGGSLLGVPYVPSKHVHKAAGGAGVNQVLAIAGDWAGSAFWGQVGGINISVADQATITDTDGTTQINLWQRNMFAVRVEVELGFAVKDDDRFVKLTGTPGA
jgi:hypothetical protein